MTRSLAFALGLVTMLVACEGEIGPMDIYDVNPRRGSSGGDQPVQIIGANFRPDSTYMVYFGEARAQHVTILDDHTLLATTPQHDVGRVSIVVASDSGPAFRIVDGFEFDEGGSGSYEHVGESTSTGERF